jgi:hypothetical protein
MPVVSSHRKDSGMKVVIEDAPIGGTKQHGTFAFASSSTSKKSMFQF